MYFLLNYKKKEQQKHRTSEKFDAVFWQTSASPCFSGSACHSQRALKEFVRDF